MKKLLLILSLACLTLANTSFAQQGLDQTTLPAGHRMAMGQDIEVYGNEQYVVLEDGSSGIYGALYKNDGTHVNTNNVARVLKNGSRLRNGSL